MRYQELKNNLKPAIPYVYLYDVGGSQTINGSYLTWDTIKTITSHFHYTVDDDRLQLKMNSSGLFRVIFETSLYTTIAGAVAYFDIYKNGTIVEGSRTYISVINYGTGSSYSQSGIITCVVFLEKGDYIQIKGDVVGGYEVTPLTIANTSRLLINFINMKGWNNSAGGREDDKGGISR